MNLLSRAALLSFGFAFTLAIRLLLLANCQGNYDTASYEEVVRILERGGDVYRETERYNYSPAWSLLLRLAAGLANGTGWTLTFVVGVFLTLFDSLTAVILYRIGSQRFDRDRGLLVALLFFANPVSVLVSSWDVQFDGIAIAFLVLAVFWAVRGVPSPPGAIAGLSLSLLAKHLTWFHPLLFAASGALGTRPFLAAFVPYLLFAMSFLPWASSWREIADHVFRHSGLRSLYGLDFLLLVPGVPDWLPLLLFVVAVGAAVYFLRRVELTRASLMLFLVVLVFIPGISTQYFVWPIALGSLFPGAGYVLYTLVATASFVQISGTSGPDSGFGPGWYGPWWASIVWLLLEIRRERNPRRAR